MNKILVFNVNWLGDVIFASPVFNALKTQYPNSKVDCLAVPRVHGILKHIPSIDRIHTFDEKGCHKSILGKINLVRELRKQKFDAVFLLHGSWTRALLVYLAGIPIRVGYDRKKRSRFLTHAYKIEENSLHRMDRYCQLLEFFGIEVPERESRLGVSTESEPYRQFLKKLNIQPDNKVVVLNPGGNWDLKRWPVDHYHLLLKKLNKSGRYTIFITGQNKDRSLAKQIINDNPHAINLCGKTNLDELCILLHRADVVVSGDSGPLHMANSLGSSVIALFGPTKEEITGPRGAGHKRIFTKDVGCNREPCYYLECPDNTCMKSLGINDIFKEIERLIAG